MISPLKEIRPGEPITAAFLNAIIRQLKAICPQPSGDILPNIQAGGTTYKLRRLGPGGRNANEVLWGVLQGEFSSGTTLTLTPSTIDGAMDDPPAANVNVYVSPYKSAYSMHEETVIEESTIIPYQEGDPNGDGSPNYYVVGSPKVVITDFQVDDDTQKLQVKQRDDFGTFFGTESDWVDKYEGDTC